MMYVQQLATCGITRRSLLERVSRHRSMGHRPAWSAVHITGGYCWRTPFKVLGVFFLGKVSPAFMPSKEGIWGTQISAPLSSPTVTHESGLTTAYENSPA